MNGVMATCQVCEKRGLPDGILVAVTVAIPKSGGHESPWQNWQGPK